MKKPIEVVIYHSVRTRNTRNRRSFAVWNDFVSWLEGLYRLRVVKPLKDGSVPRGAVPAPLISPAAYNDGATRANDNVKAWAGWCAIDIDDKMNTDEFDKFLKRMSVFRNVVYSTSSSRIEHPKFRLVFQLDAWLDAKDIPHFWYALNRFCSDKIDAQTKDLSRMFYIPGDYPDSYRFFIRNDDAPTMNAKALMLKYPFKEDKTSLMNESMKRDLMRSTRALLINRDITWSTYRDCPFVSHELITEYRALTSGWYNHTFKIMCSICSRAVKKRYPITAREVAMLMREIDADTGKWYEKRDFDSEAEVALNYVISNR